MAQQPQLRFRRADARHDAIEVDQSDGFIPGCGFLHAHLRMVLPPALSGAKPIFDVNSRLVEAVERMFESYSVEHGLPQPKRCFEANPVKRGLFETAMLPLAFSNWCGGEATAPNAP